MSLVHAYAGQACTLALVTAALKSSLAVGHVRVTMSRLSRAEKGRAIFPSPGPFFFSSVGGGRDKKTPKNWKTKTKKRSVPHTGTEKERERDRGKRTFLTIHSSLLNSTN